MRQITYQRRGAAGQQYAIIVGLISVIAILAVTQMGSGVKSLMTNTGNTLTNVVNGSVGSGGSGGSSPPPPPPPPPPPVSNNKNCSTLYATGSTSSGEYTIDPDGSGGQAPFPVYCDMAPANPGWTLVASWVAAPDSRTSAQIGFTSPVSAASTGKLSDARIVAIQSNMTTPIYRGDRISLPTSCVIYAWPVASWDATRNCSPDPAGCQWLLSETYSSSSGDYTRSSLSNGSSQNFDSKTTGSATTGLNMSYATNSNSNHRVWKPSGCNDYGSGINPPDVRFWIRDAAP